MQDQSRELVQRSVLVLRRLRESGGSARLAGERRAKVEKLVQDALSGCLILIGRPEERRNAQEILEWITMVFECVQSCGSDLDVAMARACTCELSAATAPALIWSIAQTLANPPQQQEQSYCSKAESEKVAFTFNERQERVIKNATYLARFALLCHTCELCQHLGVSVEVLTSAMAASSDPLRAILGKFHSSGTKTESIIEKTSRFASALAKLLQQISYCSAEIGSLISSPNQLSHLLVSYVELGWLARRQGDENATPRCPWRVSCSGLEATLEFLMQRSDRLGIEGTDVAFIFLKQTQDWPHGDHHFLLRLSSVILRCIAEPLLDAASKVGVTTVRDHEQELSHIQANPRRNIDLASTLPHKRTLAHEDPVRQHLKRLLQILVESIHGTFKADRRKYPGPDVSLKPSAHSLAAALASQAGASSSYLGGARRGRHRETVSRGWLNNHGAPIYVGTQEKAVMDVVTGLATAIFRLHAQAEAFDRQAKGAAMSPDSFHKSLNPSSRSTLLPRLELQKASEACFARLGASDVHWKTIWAIGSKQVFATDWSSSVFEVSAAILRSAVACMTSQASHLALSGISNALCVLSQEGLTSVQQVLMQSQKYHPDVAASGEYTIANYAGRLMSLLLFSLSSYATTCREVGHDDEATPQLQARLASSLTALVQRACSARAVYDLSLKAVLAWVPAVASALGNSDEQIAVAARTSLLEILQSVAMRGSIFEDDRNVIKRPQSKEDLETSREQDMDAVALRILEVWNALYATGSLPGWINESLGDSLEIDPSPFSDSYTQDIMLMITQHHKLQKKGSPLWFKPLIAARQLRLIRQTLEADLRVNLLPFRNFPSSFMHESEQAALGISSELVIPRLSALTSAMESYAIAWKASASRKNDPLLRLAALQAGAIGHQHALKEEMGAAGSIGTTVQALQSLAEAFAVFDCVRGRLAAAFYMHAAALLLRESDDNWEAGNAFATVANCIVGKENEDFLQDGDYKEKSQDTAKSQMIKTRDPLYLSIASAFLRESISCFTAAGANPEAQRIVDILEQITPIGLLKSPASPRVHVSNPSEQNAVSYYFLVGRTAVPQSQASPKRLQGPVRYRQVHPWAQIALESSLSVVRIVINAQANFHEKRDPLERVETELVERLQRGTGLALAEGRLTWAMQEQWEANETSTVPSARFHVEPQFHSNVAISSTGRSQNGKDAFFVRRIWPIRVRDKSVPMLRCPSEFALLPNSLDLNRNCSSLKSSSPLDSPTGILSDTGFTNGRLPQADPLRVVIRCPSPLTPTVGICGCFVALLREKYDDTFELLRRSPFGNPLQGFSDQDFAFKEDNTLLEEGLHTHSFPQQPSRNANMGRQVARDDIQEDIEPIPPPYPPPGYSDEDEDIADMKPPSNPPPEEKSPSPQAAMATLLQELSGSSKSLLRSVEARPPSSVNRTLSRQDSYSSVVSEISEKLKDRRKAVDEAIKLQELGLSAPSKDPNQLPIFDDTDDETMRPPLPPKPAQLLQPSRGAEDNKSQTSMEMQSRPASNSEPSSSQRSVDGAPLKPLIVESENPLVSENPDQEIPTFLHEGLSASPRRKLGGVSLTSSQARTVEHIISTQEGWFHGSIVDRSGLRDVTIRIVGSIDDAEHPPIARRRPSLIASMLAGAATTIGRARGDSSASAHSQQSSLHEKEGNSSSHFKSVEEHNPSNILAGPEVHTPIAQSLQVWLGKPGSGIMLRRSRSFKVLIQMNLEKVQISETVSPGVIKIVDGDHASPNQSPLLFQTDHPVEFIAALQALRNL